MSTITRAIAMIWLTVVGFLPPLWGAGRYEIQIGKPPFATPSVIPKYEGCRIGCYSFDVSPEEQDIIFIVSFHGYFTELWTSRIDGSNARKMYAIPGADEVLVNYQFIESPKYSPDGKKVAFTKTGEKGATFCILDLATCEVSDVLVGQGATFDVDWKDNATMIFVQGISGERTLCHVSIRNGKAEKIISGEFEYAYPSPDGKKILLGYTHDMDPREGWSDNVYSWEMLDLESKEQKEIVSQSRKFRGHHPVWSGDGKSFFFETDSGAVRIGLDGEVQERLKSAKVWACFGQSSILYTKGDTLYKRVEAQEDRRPR